MRIRGSAGGKIEMIGNAMIGHVADAGERSSDVGKSGFDAAWR